MSRGNAVIEPHARLPKAELEILGPPPLMLAGIGPKKGDWEIEKRYEGRRVLIGKRYNSGQKKGV